MLQALLVDRFKLAIHRDSKDFPVYVLTVGKDGPKLTPRPADYDPTAKNTLQPVTLNSLANLLSAGADKPVIDQTGISGEYMVAIGDMQRELVQQLVAQARAKAAAMAGSSGAGDAASEPAGSAVFGIVQKLGLRLEARKLPLPLIVVDHVEKTPTEN